MTGRDVDDELRQRLAEAEETIRAIQSGAVDAVVVNEGGRPRVYTLEGADHPYRMWVERMQQGALTLDKTGHVVYSNQRFADLVETPLEKVTGQPLRAFISASQRLDYDRLLAAAGQGSSQGEFGLERAGGSPVPAFLTLNALPPETSVAVGVLVTDLTTQKHRDDLAAAQAALQEADRRKDEFLAMLSHEIRNPLAPISSAVEILKERIPNDPELIRCRDVIDRQVRVIGHLLDDLLDVARISQGKLEIFPEPVDLTALADRAVEGSGFLSDRGQHDLRVTLPQHPVYVLADPVRLVQVVANLLHNAFKFTPGGGRIELSIETEGPHGVIRVRDDGIGIAPEQISRIFEMFVQLDTSLERARGGLGIGLMLVRDLVGRHGGTVAVESEGVGHGSEFVVRLPLLRRELRKDARKPDVAALPTLPRRVLVAEDNLDFSEMLKTLLTHYGHEVHVAYDGLQAVEVAARTDPDVVLLDIGLPKLSGYDAGRRIREGHGDERPVLVALTGWGDEEQRRRSDEAGFDVHLVKPVDLTVLRELIASSPRRGR